MSLDLALLPFDYDGGSFSYSHTVLRTYGGYELHDKIKQCNQLPVSDDFTSYLSREGDGDRDTHYGKTTTTPYGERLTFTTAQELIRATTEGDIGPATWAYINALKPQTKIALYWH